ncbi:SDR family oxidoreductase [Nitriliruptor alkaliphilus]|uniref:SDR family oxidoreductase n=1 Tax=Nitriliruptor alkaliphilus TaxID=427918 RepID=UPI0006990CAF|nr:SDR family oxidoreductase [Nitriliruptor alkaliphilus]
MARTVLFTGFPGFLGTELLPRVLRRDADARAVCLVQPAFLDLAEHRVEELVGRDASLAGRIELVVGDITRPDLGLGDAHGDLTARTTEVFHLAAVYDLEVARDVGMRVNVDGTRHVVDFCRACPDLERLQYVSTCYVSGRWPGIFRETDLVRGQSFNNFYEETKYLAEVIVAEAIEDGLPATIYRPSVVGGDSATGATQKFDGPYFILRWLLKQPGVAVMPTVGDPDGYRFNVVPRDFVVDAIDALAARPDTAGATYALADPEPYTIRQLIELFGEVTGKRLVTVPLPMGVAKGALRHVPGLQDLMGLPPASVDYFSHPTHYLTEVADAALAEEGVHRPDRETWFRAMAVFVRANPDISSAAMI